MRIFTLSIAVPLVLVLFALAGIGNVQAGPLDDAKAAGLIGEQPDGYLGPVAGPGLGKARSLEAGGKMTEEVQRLIDEVNAGRKSKYAEIAGKRGAPVDAVAQIAGKKLIERTPAGQFVMGSDGNWQQK
ncbi:MAG: YdbL family protein [Geminicoccaceae bacterium]